jgi:hypothetical protein
MFYSDTNKRNSNIAKSLGKGLASAAIASTALALVAPGDAHGELQYGQKLTVKYSYKAQPGEPGDDHEIEVGKLAGPIRLSTYRDWSLVVSEPHEILLTIHTSGGAAFDDSGATNNEYQSWADFTIPEFVWLDESGEPMDLTGVTLLQTGGETVPVDLTLIGDDLRLHIRILFYSLGEESQDDAEYRFTFHHAEVPEPSTYALMGSMLGAAAYLRKRKERTA